MRDVSNILAWAMNNIDISNNNYTYMHYYNVSCRYIFYAASTFVRSLVDDIYN